MQTFKGFLRKKHSCGFIFHDWSIYRLSPKSEPLFDKYFFKDTIRGRPFDSWGGGLWFFVKKRLLSKFFKINSLFRYLCEKKFVHEKIEKKCLINRL